MDTHGAASLKLLVPCVVEESFLADHTTKLVVEQYLCSDDDEACADTLETQTNF
jgi:hypothetical protein